MACLWSLGDGRVTSDQVGLVGVAAQVGSDERTERDELEPTGAEVFQGGGDQLILDVKANDSGYAAIFDIGLQTA